MGSQGKSYGGGGRIERDTGLLVKLFTEMKKKKKIEAGVFSVEASDSGIPSFLPSSPFYKNQ